MPKKRKSGYYWVKEDRKSKWEIAYYHAHDGWDLWGAMFGLVPDNALYDIDERQIIREQLPKMVTCDKCGKTATLDSAMGQWVTEDGKNYCLECQK